METTSDTQSAEIARVAVRLPPFWAEQPDVWFAQSRTTAYNPAANGLVERFHRTLKAAIICHADQQWTEALPLVRLGIHTSFKEDL
jgi:transposase InsO family protein